MGYGNGCDTCGEDNGIAVQICGKCFDRLIVAIENNLKDEKGRYDITIVDEFLRNKELNKV